MQFQDGGGFWGCRFCGGRGCLACPKESDRAYKEAFPDGPKPILTIPINNMPGDAEGQLAMSDDGCPQGDSPEVIHPDDAQKLARVIAVGTGLDTQAVADSIAAALRQFINQGRAS